MNSARMNSADRKDHRNDRIRKLTERQNVGDGDKINGIQK